MWLRTCKLFKGMLFNCFEVELTLHKNCCDIKLGNPIFSPRNSPILLINSVIRVCVCVCVCDCRFAFVFVGMYTCCSAASNIFSVAAVAKIIISSRLFPAANATLLAGIMLMVSTVCTGKYDTMNHVHLKLLLIIGC